MSASSPRSDSGSIRAGEADRRRHAAARLDGQWLGTNLADPYNHQVHVGYAHQLAPNTILAVDYTHLEGRNEFRRINLNPIVNGTACAGARLRAGIRDSKRSTT